MEFVYFSILLIAGPFIAMFLSMGLVSRAF